MPLDLREQNRKLLEKLISQQNDLKQTFNINTNFSDKSTKLAREKLVQRRVNLATTTRFQFNSYDSDANTNPNSLRSSTPKHLFYKRVVGNNQSIADSDDSYQQNLENWGNFRLRNDFNQCQGLNNLPFEEEIAMKKHRNIEEESNKQKGEHKVYYGLYKNDIFDKTTKNMLGYDWISEMLETKLSCEDMPDRYFEEMRKFRDTNSSDCYGVGVIDDNNSIKQTVNQWPLPSYVSKADYLVRQNDAEHKCVHLYRMNNRGFAIPVNVDSFGESVCPVCKKTRIKDDKTMVRVTVPKKLLPDFDRMDLKENSVIPSAGNQTLKSICKSDNDYGPGDSVGLSKHIVLGWKTARPTCAPPATFLDIKSASNGV